MPKYRKKPVVIEAAQWFKNGDHPMDYATPREGSTMGGFTTFSAQYCKENEWEGAVVRYFRRPDVRGDRDCKHCLKIMHVHGWIDTKEGGHIVCPGDWIITGVQGELYPCKPDIFAATYEPAEQAGQMDDKFKTPCALPNAYEREILEILIEECAEVQQRATKLLRFGRDEVQPGQLWNNAQRLSSEIGDLEEMIARCEAAGLADRDFIDAGRQKKIVQLRKFMQTQI